MNAEATGRIFRDGAFVSGSLRAEDGLITSIEEAPLTNDAPFIVPGFIDLHVHGFGGCDPLDDLAGLSMALARAGTTGFQPTLFPAAPTQLGEHVSDVEAQRSACRGARCWGAHLEGPFVNPNSAGALPRGDLAEPSVDGLRAILGSSTGDGRGVRTMTLAPELPGSDQLIEELTRCGVRVSLGHSLASAEEAATGFRSGAVGATHLFNAMSAADHRDLGLSGMAIHERAVYAEIIGDLVHVGAGAFEFALRMHGPERLCLVSDALVGAGTGCDVFHSHGREHRIVDGAAYYPAGPERPRDQLAGSASCQHDMVQRLTQRGVVSLEDAITMAAWAPAKALGIEREVGHLEVGARADWLVLEPENLEIQSVVIAGEALPRD